MPHILNTSYSKLIVSNYIGEANGNTAKEILLQDPQHQTGLVFNCMA